MSKQRKSPRISLATGGAVYDPATMVDRSQFESTRLPTANRTVTGMSNLPGTDEQHQAYLQATADPWYKPSLVEDVHPIDALNKGMDNMGKQAIERSEAISRSLQQPSPVLKGIGQLASAPNDAVTYVAQNGLPMPSLISTVQASEKPEYCKGGMVKMKKGGKVCLDGGGLIKGPGTGTSDSIETELPEHGFVITAKTVKAYGPEFFDKLNAAAAGKGDGAEQRGSAEVPVKVSNGEVYVTPEAVGMFGAKFFDGIIASVEGHGAEPEYEGGMIKAAGGADLGALERINRITGVTGGRQGSIPLSAQAAAEQVPAPQVSTRLAPDLVAGMEQGAQYTGPKPMQPSLTQKMGEAASYKPPVIDRYTGEVVKTPAWEGAGEKLANTGKSLAGKAGNIAKSIVTDPTAIYGVADSVNEAALQNSIQKGTVGPMDVPRMVFSLASRAPLVIAKPLLDGTGETGNVKASEQPQIDRKPVTTKLAPEQAQAVSAQAEALETKQTVESKPSQPQIAPPPQTEPQTEPQLGNRVAAGLPVTMAGEQVQKNGDRNYQIPMQGGATSPVNIQQTGTDKKGYGTFNVGYGEGKTGTLSASPELMKRFKENKGSFGVADLSKVPKAQETQLAPEEYQSQPQYIQPRYIQQGADYSQEINDLTSQLESVSGGNTLGDMIANKRKRKAIDAKLDVLMGLQNGAQRQAAEANRLSLDADQFNQRMQQQAADSSQQAIREGFNNNLRLAELGYTMNRDKLAADREERRNYLSDKKQLLDEKKQDLAQQKQDALPQRRTMPSGEEAWLSQADYEKAVNQYNQEQADQKFKADYKEKHSSLIPFAGASDEDAENALANWKKSNETVAAVMGDGTGQNNGLTNTRNKEYNTQIKGKLTDKPDVQKHITDAVAAINSGDEEQAKKGTQYLQQFYPEIYTKLFTSGTK